MVQGVQAVRGCGIVGVRVYPMAGMVRRARCVRGVREEVVMGVLSREIAAYEGMRDWLETDYFGKWVVVYDEELVGTYETFSDAAHVAVRRFGRGPYLIRQIGAPPITLPASIQYRPVYGEG